MADDVIGIMDHENITEQIIGIAHDWGTYLLSRLAIFHNDRFKKYVFLSAPYSPPGRIIDVEQANNHMVRLGLHETLGYWLFFAEDGSDEIVAENVRLIWFFCFGASNPWSAQLQVNEQSTNPNGLYL